MPQQERNSATDRQIADGALKIEKDRIIWKAYSERGGVYDMLKSFNNSVFKPAINATDYDDDENTYMICITLYNSIVLRIGDILEKTDKNLAVAEQNGDNYVPLTKNIVKEKVAEVPQKAPTENKFIKFIKTADCKLLRFKVYKIIRDFIIRNYKKIRNWIVKKTDSKKETSKLSSNECAETLEVYYESELEKISYQMRYSELLSTIKKILEEMEQLKPINEKNDNLLSDYTAKATAIGKKIQSEIFSHEEWVF